MMTAESIPVRLIDPSEKHLMPERANSSDAGIDPDGKIRDAITEALTRGGEAS